MRRFILPVVTILTAAVAAPGGAQSAAPQCDGDPAMSKDGKTTIVRTGEGHSAQVTRNGDGTVRVEQHGKNHAALAIQSDDGSVLDIEQLGANASANVTQTGGCNSSRLTQSGNGNSATVIQRGSGNRAVVRQGNGDD